MMRQRQRKTIEEVYGSKFDSAKSQVTPTHQSSGQKTGRTTERDYGYIINSNTPYTGVLATSPGNSAVIKNQNLGKETARRKSARNSNKHQPEKHCPKDARLNEEARLMSQTAKSEKLSHISPTIANGYDNKAYGSYKDTAADEVRQHHHHNHQNHHNHRHNDRDEDKDDDTDEFFELIRRTVDSAIGKSISELLNRNFRELSSKVDRFSAELKNTNALLNHMQIELNNKVGHYGEENSRHFRYLCMKSEYDKMFYQHQTMLATARSPNPDISAEPKFPDKVKISPKSSKSAPKLQRKDSDKASSTTGCACRTPKSKTPPEFKDSTKSSSDNISMKTSEIGMREVLEHIQKFCTQIQLNDVKGGEQVGESPCSSQQRNIMRQEDLDKINKEIFEDDFEEEDDDLEISSDGMTPRNRTADSRKYGGTTARGSISQRGNNNGAGDA